MMEDSSKENLLPNSPFKIKKVGIALAAYQPEPRFLAEQLHSIQVQSFRDWACVITSDSPLKPIIKNQLIAPFRLDSRFIWVENRTRLGYPKNFERAMQLTLNHGVDAVACSDQDDVWYKEKLAVSVERLEKAGRLSLVHCDMHALQDGKVVDGSVWESEMRGVRNATAIHLLIRNVVSGCGMLIDAELVRRFPEIPEEAKYHDYWYALVASLYGGVHAISQPLYAWRQHGSNVLGLREPRTPFMPPMEKNIFDFLQKVKAHWLRRRAFALAARRAGLPLSGWRWNMFLNPVDFGFSILILGLYYHRKDPTLSRACFSCGVGKILNFLSP